MSLARTMGCGSEGPYDRRRRRKRKRRRKIMKSLSWTQAALEQILMIWILTPPLTSSELTFLLVKKENCSSCILGPTPSLMHWVPSIPPFSKFLILLLSYIVCFSLQTASFLIASKDAIKLPILKKTSQTSHPSSHHAIHSHTTEIL